MTILIATLNLFVFWHGFMIGSVFIYSKDNVNLWSLCKAVLLHKNNFLKENCDYYMARKISTYLLVLATMGGIIFKYIL